MFIATKDSEDFEDFLAFLSACYDGAPEALQRGGASDAEIAQVAALAPGHTLPAFYVEYLREFGRNDGRTKVGGDGRATVEAILEHYADPIERRGTPPGGLVVGVGSLVHSRMLVWPPEGGEPPIGCFLVNPTIDYLTAVSFRHLCYQSAWRHARFCSSKSPMLQKTKTNALAAAESVFAQFRAMKYWFSDGYGVYADSDRIACYAMVEEGTTWVSVEAPTAAEREQVRDELRLTHGFH